MSRVVVGLVVLISSSAFGQIVYQPVQYQHGQQLKYFYGGDDALQHRCANRELQQGYYRHPGLFSGSDRVQREPFYSREAVFSDDVACQELSRFGYTQSDAHNEAYARAPLYFRKGEILSMAERQLDGSVIVPANAQTIGRVYLRDDAAVRPTTSTTKGVIIIIPKKQLDKPVKTDRQVAIAR